MSIEEKANDMAKKFGDERDWYDLVDLIFKITVAVVGAIFTAVTFVHALNENRIADNLATAQQSLDKEIHVDQNKAASDTKRASAMALAFQAADHSLSGTAEERSRGLLLLGLLGTQASLLQLGLDGPDGNAYLAVIKAAKQASYDSLSRPTAAQPAAPAAPHVPNGSCTKWLKDTGGLLAAGAPDGECWVYLGDYEGTVDASGCRGISSWTSQYLKFGPNTCPVALIDQTLPINSQTGAIYVRTAPAGALGVAPVVGQVSPGQSLKIDEIKPSANGANYFWGRIAAIGKTMTSQ